ncbi:MAG TPA: response regulator [Anaeromyxobacteraceae bacterium]|nr:response regulator [Anaeromyxobacteraceae bacterium]
MSSPGALVLVVEDEPQVRRFLRASLSSRGYRLLEATTAREARQLATSHNPDLFLLDLGLPDEDGVELTRDLRGWASAPIIVLSARGREEDKVKALDAGADDYLTKPFGVNELLARMRVALRHARAVPTEGALIEVGPLRVDSARREVTVDGVEVRLTPTEFKLLLLLARNAGKVLTHGMILREVWGPNATQAHYVRVQMAELRRKLEQDPARPRLLLTEVGVGYRLRDRWDD